MGNNSNTTAHIETKALFTQDGDACMSNLDQSLEIESQNAGAGTYYVIKTDRWAFDSIEELVGTIKKFIHADTAAKTKMKK